MNRPQFTITLPALFAALLCSGAQAAELKQQPAQKLQPAAGPSKPMMMKTAGEDADKGEKGGKAPASAPAMKSPAMKSPALKPATPPKPASPSKAPPGPTTPGVPKNQPTLQVPAKALQKQPGVPGRPELRPEIGGGCPDPAIVDLIPGWPQRHDDGTYTFKLMAQIKNVGDATYRSRNDQQNVVLKEGHTTLKTSGWPDRTLHPEFAPGEGTSVVQAVSNWNPNSEFLTDFTAHLTYDPDILRDGNPENDDCRDTNNSARLSVAELKRILSALP